MHDLIFMYQPKPPLSLQRKGKEKKEICLPQATLPPAFPVLLLSSCPPKKNIENKLLLHAQKAKIC